MAVLSMDNETFTDRLTDEIIDYSKAAGVVLSANDVKDVGIFILHGIISAATEIEIDSVKKSLSAIVGDENKTAEFIATTLSGISAADDEIIDEKFAATGGI